jgi:hypothetical protein
MEEEVIHRARGGERAWQQCSHKIYGSYGMTLICYVENVSIPVTYTFQFLLSTHVFIVILVSLLCECVSRF